jgi:hypothetical protein
MLKRRVIVPLQETASKALCFKLMTVLKAFYVKAGGVNIPYRRLYQRPSALS